MLNPWCMVTSVTFLVVGVLFFLGPNVVKQLNVVLDRSIRVVDANVMKYRYLIGLVLLLLSYAMFRLALLVRS